MTLVPLGDRVVLKQVEAEETTNRRRYDRRQQFRRRKRPYLCVLHGKPYG